MNRRLRLSRELSSFIGKYEATEGEVISKVWKYIKEHRLQNPCNKRIITPDEKLSKVFGSEDFSMFEIIKKISQHCVEAHG